MKKSLLTIASILLFAASLQAEVYYVDADTGDDANIGTSAALPFKTVTFAMSVAVSGDIVELLPSTWDSSIEVFPITIPSGVDLRYPGSDPAICRFDGGGTTNACFRIDSVLDDSMFLEGFTIVNCGTGIEVLDGSSTDGFILSIRGCVFELIQFNGIDAKLSGGVEVLWVEECNFSSTGANTAVNVELGSGSSLTTSVIEDNVITGMDTGVSLQAKAGSAVISNSYIRRNYINGDITANRGIEIIGSADAVAGSTIAVEVSGNQVQGFPNAGLYMEANSINGQVVSIGGKYHHNEVINNGSNVRLVTVNNGASTADIVPMFYGNTFKGATTSLGDGNGVVMDVTLPKTFNLNMAPNFGDISIPWGDGSLGGRNTLSGNETFNMVMDVDMQNIVKAERNFWGSTSSANVNASIETNGANYPSTTSLLDDIMSFSVATGALTANIEQNVILTAGSLSAFVDNLDDDATYGQMIITIDAGTWLLDPVVSDDGTTLSFTSPELLAGNHEVSLINPGGQFAVGNLEVQSEESAGGGSETGMCVVATAAHGNYDAPEVKVLRRWRNEFLLPSPAGRDFVRFYYREGPQLADWIAEREWARKGTRGLLMAPVAFAKGMLDWPRLTQGLFALVLALVGFRKLRRF